MPKIPFEKKSQYKWYKFQAHMRRRSKPADSMPVSPVSNVQEPAAFNAPAVPAEKVPPAEEIPAKTVQPDVRNVIIQEDRQKEVEVDDDAISLHTSGEDLY